MGRSSDAIVADNQVAAETYAFRCLLEFRRLAGLESEARFGWCCGGQGAWTVCRASCTLSSSQRQQLRSRGWSYGVWNTGANYNGDFYRRWRGWCKNGSDFLPDVVCTDEKAGAFFRALKEEEIA